MLSCGLSYVQDGDVRLPHAIRLRLAFLANAFEFVECVQECLQSLGKEEDMTLEDAFSLLEEMPEDLWEHEAAMAIRGKIIKILTEEVDGLSVQLSEGNVDAEADAAVAALMSKVTKALVDIIDELGPRKMQGETAEEQKKQALTQAGEALCKALGPVNGLFGEGTTSAGFPRVKAGAFYTVLPLRADIKGMSPEVMRASLESETLQVRSENDAYVLLCAWLSQFSRISDEQERRALYEQLLPLLRFHLMSLDFVSAVVSACPYANAPGLLRYILSCSTALRTTPMDVAVRDSVNMGSKDRSRSDMLCTFKSKLELADLLPLKKHPLKPHCLHKYLGLAVGFPVAVEVSHGKQGTVGVYVYVGMPSRQGFDVEGGVEGCVGFEFSIKIGDIVHIRRKTFDGKSSWGKPDSSRKSWAEVVWR